MKRGRALVIGIGIAGLCLAFPVAYITGSANRGFTMLIGATLILASKLGPQRGGR